MLLAAFVSSALLIGRVFGKSLNSSGLVFASSTASISF